MSVINELNVQGTVEADVGRFTNLIVTTQSIVTSSISQVSGSSIRGTVATDRHVFTGSLQISGSSIYDNYFLNNVAIGKTEAKKVQQNTINDLNKRLDASEQGYYQLQC